MGDQIGIGKGLENIFEEYKSWSSLDKPSRIKVEARVAATGSQTFLEESSSNPGFYWSSSLTLIPVWITFGGRTLGRLVEKYKLVKQKSYW